MRPVCNPKTQLLLKDKPKRPIFEQSENIKVNMKFISNQIRNQMMPAKGYKKKTVMPTKEEQETMTGMIKARQY